LNTVWLIVCAMGFGAMMEKTGLLERMIRSVLKAARSTGSLIAATLATAVGANAVAADQYMAIVLTGRLYQPEFRRRGLAPENLSRALEDAGTITSPLIPWNTCGAYMAATLGVATLDYLPWAFFNIVSPLVAVVLAYAGFKILRLPAGGDASPPVADASAPRASTRPPDSGSIHGQDDFHPRHVVLATHVHPRRHRFGGRPGQHLALPVHDVGQRRRRVRARLPGLHRGGGPADPDGRDPAGPAWPGQPDQHLPQAGPRNRREPRLDLDRLDRHRRRHPDPQLLQRGRGLDAALRLPLPQAAVRRRADQRPGRDLQRAAVQPGRTHGL